MSDTATRLALVREQIRRAATSARRKPEDVRLIAVTKQRRTDEIIPLIEAGVTDFGENRVGEAVDKWTGLKSAYPGARLHMIGRLQSNKADEAAQLFDVIHSLDRPSLLQALGSAAEKSGRRLQAYVQVNIGDEEQKGGVAIPELPAFLEQVRASPLSLAGLMGMPPLDREAGPYFALLAELARRHGVDGLSMGMSGDYPVAVMLGATAIRVGSALFED
jgi:PLP dependent protein